MQNKIKQAYQELVALRYQLYNGLFLTLPLDAVVQTGSWLPLLQEVCERMVEEQGTPESAIREFFDTRTTRLSEREEIDFLFKVIQYVERQIVLVDALEDAFYTQIHRVNGPDTWRQIADRAENEGAWDHLIDAIAETGIRVVLTAHPTQFYPKTVLDIIQDLVIAIREDDSAKIRDLLEQLGRTPFLRKQKPMPIEEARLLRNYLETIFYPAVGKVMDEIHRDIPELQYSKGQRIQLGFWPGGDRDGNPHVTVQVTREVATMLKTTVLYCYQKDIERLARRLTFPEVHDRLLELRTKIRAMRYGLDGSESLPLNEFREQLEKLGKTLEEKYQGLFIEKLHSLQRKVSTFGFHFASLDIRQDSRVIEKTFNAILDLKPGRLPQSFEEMDDEGKVEALLSIRGNVEPEQLDDPLLRDTAASVGVLRAIQRENGEAGAHRYIISNCRGPVDVARLVALFRLCGWGEDPISVDFVPLFETIDDLKDAAVSMRILYNSPRYKAHLENRQMHQTIMLGFSDGTKDGGYLMANWAIHTAKERLTAESRSAGVEVYFFDGRGGPPARGGGNTHLYYSSLGGSIENRQIQITLQGQTISSHYGIEEAAVHNLELLLTGGLRGKVFHDEKDELREDQRKLLDEMAAISYSEYQDLKTHPLFVPYLLERSTLRYYETTNIASRPNKRGEKGEFRFEDLRAIPFVGAWSQLKQNVPGFYGLGTSLKAMADHGRFEEIRDLYRESKLFQSFIENSMQSMSKANFGLTKYMSSDPKFGEFWTMIHEEYELTKQMVLKVSDQSELLEGNPRSQMSIRLRERVVLPLLMIQQYALIRIQQLRESGEEEYLHLYEKMVMRSMFGNINATRNAV